MLLIFTHCLRLGDTKGYISTAVPQWGAFS
jgi:hypothetical protein